MISEQGSGGRSWVAKVLGVVAVIAFVAVVPKCSTDGARRVPAPVPTVRVEPDVLEYHVTGTAEAASVTYRTGTGTQQAEVDLPMTNKGGGQGVRMEGSNIPDFKYISAQNMDSYGSVTCRIVLNGVTISENTSSGGYVIASCQA